jgi:glycerol-3-phosphate dehydrogenase (NAD(P)+)
MNVTVLGCGRWGSFHAAYSSDIGHNVILWGRENSKNMERLKKERKNEYIQIPVGVELSTDLEYSVRNAEFVIISVNSQELRNLLENIKLFDFKDKTIILCMKGIEQDTGKRLSEIVCEYLPGAAVAVWVGPGHVQNYVYKIPNCMIIDSTDPETVIKVVDNFNTNIMRLYMGSDIIGTEIGAAAKNVIGIGAGMLDGLGYTSLKGALMARGAREVSRLIKAMGGAEITAYGLSHLGDYEATLFSPYSNNRRFGELFIGGHEFDKLAEGVYTTKAMTLLAEKYKVELPITQCIYSIIYLKKDPKEAMAALFVRTVKGEFID